MYYFSSFKTLIYIIIIVGVCLRVGLFLANPVNNSYDNHLKTINFYAENKARPDPNDCWECYQPPFYYLLTASILEVSEFLGIDKQYKWKGIQLLNTLLSCLLLLIFHFLLNALKINLSIQAIPISLLAVFPRDLFSSAMVTNDYVLLFLTVLGILLLYKALNKIGKGKQGYFREYILLCFVAVIAVYTKQHGAILLLLPSSLLPLIIYNEKRKWYLLLTSVFLITLFFASLDEVWRYNKTGKLIASNQEYFDYTKDQRPGSLSHITFFTFKLGSILEEPYLSDKTLNSFSTEVWARLWFDYEWRFMSPEIESTIWFGRLSYIYGFSWSIAFLAILLSALVQFLRTKNEITINLLFFYGTILLMVLLYSLIPLIQTIRYPYFSSMKAQFLLPAIPLLFVLFAKSLQFLIPNLKHYYIYSLVILNLMFGGLLYYLVATNIDSAITSISGPLWPMP